MFPLISAFIFLYMNSFYSKKPNKITDYLLLNPSSFCSQGIKIPLMLAFKDSMKPFILNPPLKDFLFKILLLHCNQSPLVCPNHIGSLILALPHFNQFLFTNSIPLITILLIFHHKLGPI